MSLPTPCIDIAAASYRVAKPPQPIDLWLMSNEGPTPAPGALRALAEMSSEDLRRYPNAAPVSEAIAERFGVPPEQVLVTAGADEALDRFHRAFAGPDRNIVLLTPAFEMTTCYAKLSGVELREVRWTGGAFPMEEVLAAVDAQTCAVSLATPNNPTGLAVDVPTLRALAARIPDCWLLVDLVYAEFLPEDPTRDLLDLPNVIALRSLSKSLGLAGLRVGYALGPLDAILPMRAAGGPYSVASPALAAAATGVRDTIDATYRDAVASERERFTHALRGFADVPTSQANYIYAMTPEFEWLADGLAGLGIAVRRFPDALRISCPGDPAAADRVTAALETVTRPDAILFDLDGVLADVSNSYREAILSTARAFGVEATREDIARRKAQGNANNDWVVTHDLITAGAGTATFEAVRDVFEEKYHGGLHEKETLLVPRSWLVDLAERMPIGIVTGRPRRDADRFLDRFDLQDVFSTVVCMEDAEVKPSPAPVRKALSDLGATRAWMIGDTVDDVRAARAAGVVPLGIPAPCDDTDRAQTELLAAGAARVLTKLETLTELLP